MSTTRLMIAALALVAVPFVAAAEEASAPDQKQEKLICKRIARVGSLAARQRVCGTKEWWDKEQQRSRKWLEGAQDSCARRGESPMACQ